MTLENILVVGLLVLVVGFIVHKVRKSKTPTGTGGGSGGGSGGGGHDHNKPSEQLK